MSDEPVTVPARLMVNGIGPIWRKHYRRLRREGFTPAHASLAIYGAVRYQNLHNTAIGHELRGSVTVELLEPPA